LIPVQVVACQFDIVWEQPEANHRRVRELLAAVQPGALVVLPEMFSTGFSMHVQTICEATEGPTHVFLRELAREKRATVLGGVVTRSADGRGSNEAVAYGPDGELMARYAKMQPFSLAGETKHYQAGAGVRLFKCHDFAVAPFVCYDLRFPEVFRQAVRAKADLLAVIANWPAARDAHWRALLIARAIENQAYVVGVNRTGSDPHAEYAGRSMIVDPRGEILAEGGPGEQLVTAEVEIGPLEEYRRQFPALADMRADLFTG
jgi:omega-amidase